jgi:Fe-S cluster assembly protein SufB
MPKNYKYKKCISCPKKICPKKFIAKPGLSIDIIKKISFDKQEPNWLLDLRLKALELFHKTSLPKWGPSLNNLNLDNIVYYLSYHTKQQKNWMNVSSDFKKTFDNLGIVSAEKKFFSGVGAQVDSQSVYHNLKKEFEIKGVIFESMDVAIKKYPELIKEYFMTKCVPIDDHKFSMLHGAVFSGGTFIYVPANTNVDVPLQAYFRMNSQSMGQFEHTLIIVEENSSLHYIEGCSAVKYNENSLHVGCVEIFVKKGSKVKYSSIENWSKNVYNLNTKRAIVEEGGIIEWVSGNMGSKTTMLYPMSVLVGDNSQSKSFGVVFAGNNQNQDVGTKVVHIGKNTTSIVKSKSIAKNGGIANYRGLIKITKNAINAKSYVECDTLILDSKSNSMAYPTIKSDCNNSVISHEAKVGKISEDQIYYLKTRGFDEDSAKRFIISGFVSPIANKFPMEYAIEFNKLVDTQMNLNVGK